MEHAQTSLFRLIDTDNSGTLSREEWMWAFDALDADRDGCISRKEWYLKQGQTVIFDAIQHKHFAAIQRKEWESTFQAIDRDGSGTIDQLIDLPEWTKVCAAVAQVAESAKKGRSLVVAEPLCVDVRALSGEIVASVQVTPAWTGAHVKTAVNSQMKSDRTVAMVSILRECGTVAFGDDQTVESVGLTASESLQVVLTESEERRRTTPGHGVNCLKRKELRAPPSEYSLRTDISCKRCGFRSVYRTSNWSMRCDADVWNFGICANPDCGYEWSELS